MIVSGEAVARFVSVGLGIAHCPPYVAIGIERDGEIVAGVLFNHFEGADVHLSAYGKGWTRAFYRAIGTYVYDQLGCERMTVVTADDYVAKLAERLGGEREGIMRNHFGNGKDAILLGILREDYRY